MELLKVIENSGVDKAVVEDVMKQFEDFKVIASHWGAKAKEIVVTDETQTEVMAEARKGRMLLKKVRIDLGHTKDRLKRRSIDEGKAIQAIYNSLMELVVPLEQHLDKQEKFIEIQQANRELALHNRRFPILLELDVDYTLYDLRKMPEEDFNRLVESTKENIRLKLEEVERLEKERIAKEKAEAKERQRILKQNEKLKAEAKERDAKLAEERKKTEATEKEKRDAEAKIEDERQAKIEAEQKAERERIAREEAEKETQLARERELYAKKIKEEVVAEKKKIDGVPTASEALFMFVAELTTRLHAVTASSQHDASIWADLVDEFCKRNNLKEPRDNYPDYFVRKNKED